MNGPTDYWIGVHNLSNMEVLVLQAESVDGDDFGKDGTFDITSANYLEIGANDILYGRFKKIALLKSGSALHTQRMRGIIGV